MKNHTAHVFTVKTPYTISQSRKNEHVVKVGPRRAGLVFEIGGEFLPAPRRGSKVTMKFKRTVEEAAADLVKYHLGLMWSEV